MNSENKTNIDIFIDFIYQIYKLRENDSINQNKINNLIILNNNIKIKLENIKKEINYLKIITKKKKLKTKKHLPKHEDIIKIENQKASSIKYLKKKLKSNFFKKRLFFEISLKAKKHK